MADPVVTPNVVIRTPSPVLGQGSWRALSQRTGWEYEHDETDAQIDAIEEIILAVRAAGNVVLGAPQSVRGAVFSWTSSTDDGEGAVLLATSYVRDGLWVSERWLIDSDGVVHELGVV